MLHPEKIHRLMERKRRDRAEAIESLHANGAAAGGPDDAGYWALVHDLEHAPLTTNLAQLAELGIDPPDPRIAADDEITAALEEMVNGLALLEVFLLRTNHLDDRGLYELLRGRILREPVREVPPGCGSREWIDVGGGGDRETWLAWYADEDERRQARDHGEVVPLQRTPRADRDAALPRPIASPSRAGTDSDERSPRAG